MLGTKAKTEALLNIYERMLVHFGPRGWWPGETREETIVGAILTQNVAWRNVERAIANLKAADLLSLAKLHQAPSEVIEPLIIPSRFYKQKTRKIKDFTAFLFGEHGGDLDRMFSIGVRKLRPELLFLKGIGPETADCILLYAGFLPSFTCDAYTRRIFGRLGFFAADATYEEMRNFFMKHLPHQVPLFNEFHAQIDGIGHHYCQPKDPRCGECPLSELCKKKG
ncbi:MAG TPA: hypothetical protein V6C82_09255 [Chroococcales cyanobacterium]|jgi:endonuclease-3 related protein